MKGIYEFCWPMRRSADIEGTFIADSEDVAKITGKYVYFGEIAGKHSEVYGNIDPGDITLRTDDQDFIDKFEEIMGEGWSTGINPLEYYEPEEDEDEEEDE